MTDSSNQGFKPFLGKKTGLAALLEKQKISTEIVKEKKEEPFKYAEPEKTSEKIRIIFDDSGSMYGQAIEDVREGCIEFLKNCIVNQTAVAVHPMNYISTDLSRLTTDLPALSVLIRDIKATDYTPLIATWKRALETTPKATRYIIFSDGAPDSRIGVEDCIAACVENKVKCDTVYISPLSYQQAEEESHVVANAPGFMRYIAEKTGGIFLIFERGKGNFKKAFKYLSPTLRLQLAASTEMQKLLQEGKL